MGNYFASEDTTKEVKIDIDSIDNSLVESLQTSTLVKELVEEHSTTSNWDITNIFSWLSHMSGLDILLRAVEGDDSNNVFLGVIGLNDLSNDDITFLLKRALHNSNYQMAKVLIDSNKFNKDQVLEDLIESQYPERNDLFTKWFEECKTSTSISTLIKCNTYALNNDLSDIVKYNIEILTQYQIYDSVFASESYCDLLNKLHLYTGYDIENVLTYLAVNSHITVATLSKYISQYESIPEDEVYKCLDECIGKHIPSEKLSVILKLKTRDINELLSKAILVDDYTFIDTALNYNTELVQYVASVCVENGKLDMLKRYHILYHYKITLWFILNAFKNKHTDTTKYLISQSQFSKDQIIRFALEQRCPELRLLVLKM